MHCPLNPFTWKVKSLSFGVPRNFGQGKHLKIKQNIRSALKIIFSGEESFAESIISLVQLLFRPLPFFEIRKVVNRLLLLSWRSNDFHIPRDVCMFLDSRWHRVSVSWRTYWKLGTFFAKMTYWEKCKWLRGNFTFLMFRKYQFEFFFSYNHISKHRIFI